jgi:hypothetical protein
MKYTPKFRGTHVQLVIPEQALAQWRRVVAFRKAMNHLHWAMCAVWYWCTTTAIEMASKGGLFCIVVLFAVALVAAEGIWIE